MLDEESREIFIRVVDQAVRIVWIDAERITGPDAVLLSIDNDFRISGYEIEGLFNDVVSF